MSQFRQMVMHVITLVGVLMLAACQAPPNVAPTAAATSGAGTLPTSAAATTAPTAAAPTEAAATAVPPTETPAPPTQVVQPAAPTPIPPQAIFIDTPPPGTLIGSPVVLTGRTARAPANGQLTYRMLNVNGQDLGSGTVPVTAAGDGSGTFTAQLAFSLPRDGGPVRAELSETNQDGSLAAASTLELYVQAQYQTISIDTPPPGTQVGSPVVLTGRLARTPFQGRLNYVVTNSSRQQIGAGTFNVGGAAGRPTSYTGSLNFNPPLNGDTINVQLYDQDPANGAIVASQQINLTVAPTPQQILIDSPPPGTVVGSPMVITGRTIRFPFNGTLNYRVTDPNGQQIGAGTFAVVGSVTSSTQYNTQVTFTPPREGGRIRVTVYDQNPANGAVVTSNALEVEVLPQYQAILIDTPPAGTTVGSPVVLTGRTNLYPNQGQLQYRVYDAGNAQIGSGAFPVSGNPSTRGSFNASLSFTEPANGGSIRVQLLDQASNGSVTAQAEIALTVAPPPPPLIVIETPSPGTTVGSPVVLTGRVTYAPANGQLEYRVRAADGTLIGQGTFPVTAQGRQATFNASLTFTEPPVGGNIGIEILGANPTPGAPPVSSAITLYVTPKISPLST